VPQNIVVESRKGATWIRLNRPERLNSFDAEMADEIRSAIDDARESAAIVLTGEGRAFCAGGYLASLAATDTRELRKLFRACLALLDSIRMSPRPVIAAVNGAAAGGGNEIVIACDFAIAAESATLGQTGPKVGSSPVFGGANLLSLSVGEKRAKEISMLCRRYPAATALEYGWVNAVVPDAELEAEVDRWVEEISRMSPRFLEITKMSSNVWWNQLRDNYLQGMGQLIQSIGSFDQREGSQAFMERRAPEWEPLFGHDLDDLDNLNAGMPAPHDDASDGTQEGSFVKEGK
jgi:enoyl-CoA hydratase/carnithine racemase